MSITQPQIIQRNVRRNARISPLIFTSATFLIDIENHDGKGMFHLPNLFLESHYKDDHPEIIHPMIPQKPSYAIFYTSVQGIIMPH